MQTILVCDDDKQIVEAIDIYLTGEGFKVIKAYDGYEALEYLDKNEVDLLIVDVMMHPHHPEGQGEQQHTHHHSLRQVRGCR